MKFMLNVILTSASAFTHVSLYGLRTAVTPSTGHLVRALSPLGAPPATPATRGQQRPALVGRTRHALRMCGTAAPHNLTVSTFNLLCPAYRRVPGKPDNVREADTPDDYLERNKQILFLPLFTESDVICCQEFWYSNADVFNMYVNALNSKYRMHGLQRPGPGGSVRPDGLFMAISREFEVVHEADIDFEDAAGRCAQLLHLRRAHAEGGSGISELLVANVHLLFPHNEVSGRIRVREVHKLLTYMERYKTTLERPPPAIICGDLNSPVDSRVIQFLMRYGWQSTFSSAKPDAPWVSHFTHERQAKAVDYIWLLNPSRPRPPVPDWTDLVFSEMAAQLARRGFERPADAWDMFVGLSQPLPPPQPPQQPEEGTTGEGRAAESGSTGTATGGGGGGGGGARTTVEVDCEGFRRALNALDAESGDALSTLTDAEVASCVSSCDSNGDGAVDAREWCARFGAALVRLRGEQLVTDVDDGESDMEVASAALSPSCLEVGRWPSRAEWDLSDHGVLTSTFKSGGTPSTSEQR